MSGKVAVAHPCQLCGTPTRRLKFCSRLCSRRAAYRRATPERWQPIRSKWDYALQGALPSSISSEPQARDSL